MTWNSQGKQTSTPGLGKWKICQAQQTDNLMPQADRPTNQSHPATLLRPVEEDSEAQWLGQTGPCGKI